MPSDMNEGKGKSLKDCIRHFTPAWFAAIMGTGAVSILFHNFPYHNVNPILKGFTAAFFFLNLALFILFSGITLARYIMFPDIWPLMLRHPVQSLFIGTFPMGATTLISIGVGLVYQQWGFGGKPFVYLLWASWWILVVLSFACAFLLVHVMETKQDHSLNRMTTVWLLPVVTLVVASATGGVLAPVLLPFSPQHALITLTLSTVLVSMGLGLAFMILTMYFLRLIVYGLPPGANVLSVFIPLGPMGQGGYSILLIGKGFQSILPLTYGNSTVLRDTRTGDIIFVVCLCMAMVLWSLATMWMLYALCALLQVLPKTLFPFKLPFWGLIFPNGVYANLTIQLYLTLDSPFFRVWGAIYSVATMLLWLFVFAKTLAFVRRGAIFEAPCLDEIDMTRVKESSNGQVP